MYISGEETARRIDPDRRKRPTSFINRYSLIGGRRRTVRRKEDKNKHVFVDLYSTRLFITLLILSTLSLSDSYFTLTLIKEDIAVEINPVMSFFLGYGNTPFIFSKFLITSIPLFILCICKNCFITRVLVVSTVICYLLIILYELNLMYQIFPLLKLNVVF